MPSLHWQTKALGPSSGKKENLVQARGVEAGIAGMNGWVVIGVVLEEVVAVIVRELEGDVERVVFKGAVGVSVRELEGNVENAVPFIALARMELGRLAR